MNAKKRIVIAGGSGFLGRTLAKYCTSLDYEVIVLTRTPTPKTTTYRTVIWDAKTLGPWTTELESTAAVINLAGRSVNCRYNSTNQRQMIKSRVNSTLLLGQAISQCKNPPPVWLNSSTATIYRHRYDAPNNEATGLYGAEKEAKDTYSLKVAHAWEDAFHTAYENNSLEHTRGIILRTAMVFGKESGGVYETLGKLVRLGLGGTMGHGRQFVSWLHADDFCGIIKWLIEKEDTKGIYNLVAPSPLPNREMMSTMRKTLGKYIGLPAPRLLLEIGAFFLRTETELIVKSRYVTPARLLEEGYTFQHTTFSQCMNALEKAPQ